MAEQIRIAKPISRSLPLGEVSVYRAFLSGGRDNFRLLPWDWLLVAGWSGALVVGIHLFAYVVGGEDLRGTFSGGRLGLMALFTTAGACTTAGLAARWLGRRPGRLSGLIDAYGMVSLWLWPGLGLLEGFYTLLARWTLGSFAIANLAGPIPLFQGKQVQWTFWLCLAGCGLIGGWTGGLVPVGVCLLSLAWLEDSRGLRFFLCPMGWALGGTILLGGKLFRTFICPEGAFWIGRGFYEEMGFRFWMDPSGSLLLGGVWASLLACGMASLGGLYISTLKGGAISPIGRFLVVWGGVVGIGILGPGLLVAGTAPPIMGYAGKDTLGLLLASFVPVWAVAASVGWSQSRVLLRRSWRFPEPSLPESP